MGLGSMSNVMDLLLTEVVQAEASKSQEALTDHCMSFLSVGKKSELHPERRMEANSRGAKTNKFGK